MVKCNTCKKWWWFSREVQCDCAKPKRMVANQHLRTNLTASAPTQTQQNYTEENFRKAFLNDWSHSDHRSEQPSHQDNSNRCDHASTHNGHSSTYNDHSHSSCNSSSYGSGDGGSSSGSDYSSSSSSSSDY